MASPLALAGEDLLFGQPTTQTPNATARSRQKAMNIMKLIFERCHALLGLTSSLLACPLPPSLHNAAEELNLRAEKLLQSKERSICGSKRLAISLRRRVSSLIDASKDSYDLVKFALPALFESVDAFRTISLTDDDLRHERAAKLRAERRLSVKLPNIEECYCSAESQKKPTSAARKLKNRTGRLPAVAACSSKQPVQMHNKLSHAAPKFAASWPSRASAEPGSADGGDVTAMREDDAAATTYGYTELVIQTSAADSARFYDNDGNSNNESLSAAVWELNAGASDNDSFLTDSELTDGGNSPTSAAANDVVHFLLSSALLIERPGDFEDGLFMAPTAGAVRSRLPSSMEDDPSAAYLNFDVYS